MNYPYQDNPSQINFFTEAVATRLSTTAGTLMRGAHWLEGWSLTQKVSALSPGESEFYSQGSGFARGLLMKQLGNEATLR